MDDYTQIVKNTGKMTEKIVCVIIVISHTNVLMPSVAFSSTIRFT